VATMGPGSSSTAIAPRHTTSRGASGGGGTQRRHQLRIGWGELLEAQVFAELLLVLASLRRRVPGPDEVFHRDRRVGGDIVAAVVDADLVGALPHGQVRALACFAGLHVDDAHHLLDGLVAQGVLRGVALLLLILLDLLVLLLLLLLLFEVGSGGLLPPIVVEVSARHGSSGEPRYTVGTGRSIW
jgi:hypothetical protein